MTERTCLVDGRGLSTTNPDIDWERLGAMASYVSWVTGKEEFRKYVAEKQIEFLIFGNTLIDEDKIKEIIDA